MRNQFRLFMQTIIVFILVISLTVSYANPDISLTLANKNYLLLEAELGRYQIASQRPWIEIQNEIKLRPGKHYPAIPLIRERLELSSDLPNNIMSRSSTLYDKELVRAVKHFQERHSLQPDGIIGVKTTEQLNITPNERIRKLQLNMNRWALLSRQLSERFIIVNIPDYQLYLFDHGNQVMMMRAIVGKPDINLQTPELKSRITRIVFNPSWHVPNTIAMKDLIPKIHKDPNYLDEMHIKVYEKNGNALEPINSDEINWKNVQADYSSYTFRQEPGEGNALGLVKFEFPNPYAVYLHDTPAKSLFEQTNRNLSHGCVRLERPFELVNYLLQDKPKWDEDNTQTILDSGKTTYVPISKPIPIYITYITAWADENGAINYRNDIYQRDI